MLKVIACIAILLTSMSAIADKNNGVGVDTQMKYYAINGAYKCLVFPFLKGEEQVLDMEVLGSAAMLITGDNDNKNIIMQIFTTSGEQTKMTLMPPLRLYRSSSALTSYMPIDKKLNKNRTYSLIVKASQMAYVINQGENGMNIIIDHCESVED
ncbi:hypothetical protein [Xenorhabdus sp. BG5]|uniref:hypothetical protein n=1 Tax=Xenorhabdus sp. BG5 TaxID=2782014 RepID=UPI0018814575|nr:hypothetical protein [Xenorhabdus sp. BG5]MBE8596867.1 hypothetical protein [Xenorhabdus sp. BG5]